VDKWRKSNRKEEKERRERRIDMQRGDVKNCVLVHTTLLLIRLFRISLISVAMAK